MPGEVQIASDNRHIVYSARETDWEANQTLQHLYALTTAPEAAPRQITRGDSDESGPRATWSGGWACRPQPTPACSTSTRGRSRGGAEHVLHSGFAYLLNNDRQLDLHFGFGLSAAAPRSFFAAGYSVRF